MLETQNPPSRAERLAIAQRNAARLRTEAFVEYAPDVCGVKLRPITLETFNALDAFGSAFFHGGAVEFLDVVNFIWLHHPEFGQDNRETKARVTRHVWRALNPRFPGVNALIWFASQLPRFRWLRRFKRVPASDRHKEAVAEIRRLIHEAIGDMPRGDGKGEPLPYAFQASMLNTFRRALGMSFDEVRRMPMKQLVQHFREHIHYSTRGKTLMLTQEEEDIFAEDLAVKTAAAQKNNPEEKPRV